MFFQLFLIAAQVFGETCAERTPILELTPSTIVGNQKLTLTCSVDGPLEMLEFRWKHHGNDETLCAVFTGAPFQCPILLDETTVRYGADSREMRAAEIMNLRDRSIVISVSSKKSGAELAGQYYCRIRIIKEGNMYSSVKHTLKYRDKPVEPPEPTEIPGTASGTRPPPEPTLPPPEPTLPTPEPTLLPPEPTLPTPEPTLLPPEPTLPPPEPTLPPPEPTLAPEPPNIPVIAPGSLLKQSQENNPIIHTSNGWEDDEKFSPIAAIDGDLKTTFSIGCNAAGEHWIAIILPQSFSDIRVDVQEADFSNLLLTGRSQALKVALGDKDLPTYTIKQIPIPVDIGFEVICNFNTYQYYCNNRLSKKNVIISSQGCIKVKEIVIYTGAKNAKQHCLQEDDPTGLKYRGYMSKTKSGTTCNHWQESEILEGNYCRNLRGSTSDRPWCYTSGPETDYIWDQCNKPPPCADNFQIKVFTLAKSDLPDRPFGPPILPGELPPPVTIPPIIPTDPPGVATNPNIFVIGPGTLWAQSIENNPRIEASPCYGSAFCEPLAAFDGNINSIFSTDCSKTGMTHFIVINLPRKLSDLKVMVEYKFEGEHMPAPGENYPVVISAEVQQLTVDLSMFGLKTLRSAMPGDPEHFVTENCAFKAKHNMYVCKNEVPRKFVLIRGRECMQIGEISVFTGVKNAKGHCLDEDDPTGIKYRGNIATTKHGIPCDDWIHTPSQQYWHPNHFPELIENYCRNPSKSEAPWCYTRGSSNRWEFCILSPTCTPNFIIKVFNYAIPQPEPTVEPIVIPKPEPTIEPIVIPKPEPTIEPIVIPEPEPTIEPIVIPTLKPTEKTTVVVGLNYVFGAGTLWSQSIKNNPRIEASPCYGSEFCKPIAAFDGNIYSQFSTDCSKTRMTHFIVINLPKKLSDLKVMIDQKFEGARMPALGEYDPVVIRKRNHEGLKVDLSHFGLKTMRSAMRSGPEHFVTENCAFKLRHNLYECNNKTPRKIIMIRSLGCIETPEISVFTGVENAQEHCLQEDDPLGFKYRGNMHTTKFGAKCSYWETVPTRTYWRPYWFPWLIENYCRNPSKSETPWCYIKDPSFDYHWDFCNLPPRCASNFIMKVFTYATSTPPEVPTKPEIPVEPEVPTKPEIPVEPEVPTKPEIPVEPEIPTKPELPVAVVTDKDLIIGPGTLWEKNHTNNPTIEASPCYESEFCTPIAAFDGNLNSIFSTDCSKTELTHFIVVNLPRKLSDLKVKVLQYATRKDNLPDNIKRKEEIHQKLTIDLTTFGIKTFRSMRANPEHSITEHCVFNKKHKVYACDNAVPRKFVMIRGRKCIHAAEISILTGGENAKDHCLNGDDPTGIKYKGNIATTQHGTPCDNWSSIPSQQYWHSDHFPELIKNYCRNPSKSESTWCYIRFSQFSDDWDFCNLPPWCTKHFVMKVFAYATPIPKPTLEAELPPVVEPTPKPTIVPTLPAKPALWFW